MIGNLGIIGVKKNAQSSGLSGKADLVDQFNANIEDNWPITAYATQGTITPSTTSVTEGNAVTFTVSVNNWFTGTLYYVVTGGPTDADFEENASGSFSVTNGSGTFDLTLVADGIAESDTFQVQLRRDSTTGLLFDTTATISVTDAALAVVGEAMWTTTGTHSWTVPANITSISAVVVGGGGASGGSGSNVGGQGGSGAGLAYQNSISVTAGESLTVIVGSGGLSTTTTGGSGGYSAIMRSSTTLVRANGGNGGLRQNNGYQVGGSGGSTLGYDGGGDGGIGGDGYNNGCGGAGGGAGGYSGSGGSGGTGNSNSGQTGGTGGGAGGGESDSVGAGGGGGVGLYGEGASGAATGNLDGSYGTGGYGGSGGVKGQYHTGASSGMGKGGAFGGGGGADEDDSPNKGGDGGDGGVRIIWGPGRSFPSTDTDEASSDGNVSLNP